MPTTCGETKPSLSSVLRLRRTNAAISHFGQFTPPPTRHASSRALLSARSAAPPSLDAVRLSDPPPAAMERAGGEAGAPTPTPAAVAAAGGGVAKARSCKGCLYYSSVLRSRGRRPVCVGFSRPIPNVSERMIGKIELDAIEAGRNLSNFRYGCVGYSIYIDDKETSVGIREKKPPAHLPACIGVELLADRKAPSSTEAQAYYKKEALQRHEHKPGPPQPHQHKPGHAGDGFSAKFQRNARLVANGVAKNLNKVGTYVKDTVGDMMDKRPK